MRAAAQSAPLHLRPGALTAAAGAAVVALWVLLALAGLEASRGAAGMAMLVLMAATAGGRRLYLSARAKREAGAGGFRAYSAFLLDTEPCPAVAVEYARNFRVPGPDTFSLRIENRATGKTAEFEMMGKKPHLPIARKEPVVVVFRDAPGCFVYPKAEFEKITGCFLPA